MLQSATGLFPQSITRGMGSVGLCPVMGSVGFLAVDFTADGRAASMTFVMDFALDSV